MLRARIVIDETRWIDCTIRDLAAYGAGITLPNEQIVPKNVFLIATRDSMAHEAEVRWQARRNLGLLFLRSFSLQQDLPTEIEFLKKLSDCPNQTDQAAVKTGNS